MCIFFDFRKVFDTVPYRRLMERLTEIGIHPLFLSWLCSYISEREQHVLVNGEHSQIYSYSFWSSTRLSSRPIIVSYLHRQYYQGTALAMHKGYSLADDMLIYKPVQSCYTEL